MSDGENLPAEIPGDPMPPERLVRPDRRVLEVWKKADEWCAHAEFELGIARSLGITMSGKPDPEIARSVSPQNEKKREMRRAALKSAQSCWKTAIDTARFALELEKSSGIDSAKPVVQLDQMTATLLERQKAFYEARSNGMQEMIDTEVDREIVM